MDLTAHSLLNLAALLMYNINLSLGQRTPTTSATTPTVNFFLSGHEGPYSHGADATMVCEIHNLNPATMIVSMNRTRSGLTSTLLYNEQVPNSAPSNVEYLGSFNQVNSVWKIIRLTSVTQEDAGVYTCTLMSTATDMTLNSDSMNVQVQYVPTPLCSVAGRASVDITYTIGEEVTFVCVSELGVPTASVLWGVSGNGPSLPDRETTVGTDSITTLLPLTMTSDHNGSTYTCFSFSIAGNTLSCAIGPLSVVVAGMTTPTVPGVTTGTPIPTEPEQTSDESSVSMAAVSGNNITENREVANSRTAGIFIRESGYCMFSLSFTEL